MTREEAVVVLQEKAVARLDAEVTLDAPYPGDSLSLIEWVMDLEDAFGVELPEEEVTGTQTVADLLDLVLGKL